MGYLAKERGWSVVDFVHTNDISSLGSGPPKEERKGNI